jgi:hypothetical protein
MVWNAPPEGDYVLRLRALEAGGLEGLSAEHAFVLNAHPVPAAPLKPAARPGYTAHSRPSGGHSPRRLRPITCRLHETKDSLIGWLMSTA